MRFHRMALLAFCVIISMLPNLILSGILCFVERFIRARVDGIDIMILTGDFRHAEGSVDAMQFAEFYGVQTIQDRTQASFGGFPAAFFSQQDDELISAEPVQRSFLDERWA